MIIVILFLPKKIPKKLFPNNYNPIPIKKIPKNLFPNNYFPIPTKIPVLQI